MKNRKEKYNDRTTDRMKENDGQNNRNRNRQTERMTENDEQNNRNRERQRQTELQIE